MEEKKAGGKRTGTNAKRKQKAAVTVADIPSKRAAGRYQQGAVEAHKSNSEAGSGNRRGGHSYKPVHTRLYVTASLIGNFILGVMGLGLGFLFFLAKVIATGSLLLNLLVFGVGAVIIVLYLYIILLANRFLVQRCSNKKSKRIDKNRLFFSMVYVISVLVVSLAYSFLRAAIEANLVS